jgi:ABC-type multidrug transport system fused ATPase/permease subunit
MKKIYKLLRLLKKVISILDNKEKRFFYYLSIAFFFVALVETFGVVLIIPFIEIASNPEIINSNYQLNLINDFFQFSNTKNFILFLGISYFFYLIFSQAFKAVIMYFQLRYTFSLEASISKRLLESYLRQTYSWFLDKHSGDMGKGILSEVAETIHYSLNPLLAMISQLFLTIQLIVLIVLVNPIVALITLLFLLVLNLVIFNKVKNWIKLIGINKVMHNQRRYKTVVEAFGAIKEIKLSGIEKSYSNKFSSAASDFSTANSNVQIVSILPKYLLEALSFGFLILFILYNLNLGNNLTEVLPILSMFAFAALRLIPAFQQIFSSLNKINFSTKGLDDILYRLNENKNLEISKKTNDSLQIKNKIEINDLNFIYPNSNRMALNKINLSILAGKKIGVVGSTGSGKTTLIDILLGLLKPTNGKISLDGKEISKLGLREWQNSIGYVPQNIFLSDKTIAENIAFGLSLEELDIERVKKVCEIASLNNFITEELDQSYFTEVGERGVRLSGGQRQRIGIARALYHNPSLLVLDEATSALDNLTEKIIIESIANHSKNITTIVIAHRLNTIKNCDCIYYLEKGEVKSHGTYEELTLKSKEFKKLTTSLAV